VHSDSVQPGSRAAASTRVLLIIIIIIIEKTEENYSSSKLLSNFLLLEYSLISISGCKLPFPVAVFSLFAVQTAVNWWIVGIYGNLGLRDFICNLPACALNAPHKIRG